MPSAALRPCAHPSCPVLVPRGKCPTHRRAIEHYRGTRHSRGYGLEWDRFRIAYLNELVRVGIFPKCGATLPQGPQTYDSQCRLDGVNSTDRLHLDHEPPLETWERIDSRLVCDASRIQLLCPSCHSRKTERERRP